MRTYSPATEDQAAVMALITALVERDSFESIRFQCQVVES